MSDKVSMPSGTFRYSSDGPRTTIAGFEFNDVIIPDAISGKTVTCIGAQAFARRGDLRSVTIPDGVSSIGDYAFQGCGRLESVTIPEGVTYIGAWAFAECKSLESVTIPDGVTIADGAFFGTPLGNN